jgi:hypothetical protein
MLLERMEAGLADRSLSVLLEMNVARRGAVFAGLGPRLRLVTSRSVDQEVLDTVQMVWARFRPRLEAGKAVAVDGQTWVLLPVMAQRQLIGAVYLDAVDPVLCPESERERLLGLVARAVAEVPPSASGQVWNGLLETLPANALAREQLRSALENNEWNVARVARLMHVTRVTIYRRIERYGLERKRFAKSELARTVSGT